MNKKLHTNKKTKLFFIFGLSLIGTLPTLFLFKPKKEQFDTHLQKKNPEEKVEREKKSFKKIKTSTPHLYVPPKTNIKVQKLQFKALKKEIEAQKKKKVKLETPHLKKGEKSFKKVFLSFYPIEKNFPLNFKKTYKVH